MHSTAFLTKPIIILILLTAPVSVLQSQNRRDEVAGIPVNYNESLAGTYTLPDPLVFPNGKKVKNIRQWEKKRRPQIVALFEEYQYGRIPVMKHDLSFRVFDPGTPALNGKAIRKQVMVYLTGDTSDHKMDLLIYLPSGTDKPVPLFFNLSFVPNALVTDDPGVKRGFMWSREGKRIPVQPSGGFGKMDIERFLSDGIGFATVYYGDIEPDFADGIKYGIRGQALKPGAESPAPDEWGAIAAWSWGLSRAMDYFQTDPLIDSKKVALFGISRLAKTVLWTGARDTRFAMVISSCGGEGGAALSRRWYGETIDHITHPSRYFYWFAANWRTFKDEPSRSPVDGHMLVALMAPRPLLIQTGDTDGWADPKGEFLAAVAGGPVYELYGKKALRTDIMPAPGTPLLNDLGYLMHSGGHGVVPSDFDVFIQFMKMHLLK